jgi:putative FmdB family regulatory protein
MPIYEYECGACGHRFEMIKKHTDKRVRTCPECGERKVERLIHAPAIQFKGDGWYVTDYSDQRKKDKKAAQRKSGESSSSSKSDTGSKSESKSGGDKSKGKSD